MILQSLYQLYDRLADDPDYQIAPPGYSLQKITFKVVLKKDGTLFGIEDARQDVEGHRPPRQVLVPGSGKPPGSGLNPRFLWDNTQYMLGFKPDDTNPDRTRTASEAFRNLHLEREDDIDSDAFSAVCRFLESWEPASAREYHALVDAASVGYGVFQIVGETRLVHQDPAVEQWWDNHIESRGGGQVLGQCLVTGKTGPIARLHRKVGGIGSTKGPLTSFNDDTHESYGKKQSYNAPVSTDAAFRYATALDALLDGPMRNRHRLWLGGDTTVVFWTDKPTIAEDIFAEFATEGSGVTDTDFQDEERLQRIERFLEAVRRGGSAYDDLDDDTDTKFYLLALSPSVARITVRFFEQSTVRALLDNLRQHHRDIGLTPRPAVGRRKADPEFPSIRSLLQQTARVEKDIPPLLAAPLMRSVVSGHRYPDALYQAVLRRVQTERAVRYLSACVLKGYLNRNLDKELPMSLDAERPDPAYRLGRLFAALEKTQKDALGENLNRTIRSTYYSSASANPGSVFPRLLRTYQHHLAKLEGGHRVNRERLVQAILAPVEAFPTHLSLAEQGVFAIGYYHQAEHFYTKKTVENQPTSE